MIKEEARLVEAPIKKVHSNIESKWDGRADRALNDLVWLAQEYVDLGMGDDLDTIIAIIEKKALPEMKRRRKLGQQGSSALGLSTRTTREY